jgi:hypothetical protein
LAAQIAGDKYKFFCEWGDKYTAGMQTQNRAIEWEGGFFLTLVLAALVVIPNPSDGLPAAGQEGSGSLTESHGSPGGGWATQEAEDIATVGRGGGDRPSL